MKDKVLGELKNTFKPEFLNRIDATIVFHSLRREDVRQIVDLLLNRVRDPAHRAADRAARRRMTPRTSWSRRATTRSMARGLCAARSQNLVEDPLAEGLLQGKYRPGDIVEAVVRNGTVELEVRERHEEPLVGELPAPPEAALSAGDDTSR